MTAAPRPDAAAAHVQAAVSAGALPARGRGLIERIRAHAARAPGGRALAFEARGAAPVELTWAALAGAIDAQAVALVEAGVRPGDVAFVLSAHPGEQTLGFLAAMAAGALPSILSFPSVKQSEARFFETLRPIAAATGARWIVCAATFAPAVARAQVAAAAIALPPLAALCGASAPAPGALGVAPSGAFLQFSSGTTGLRKCVRIDARMLDAQAAAYREALALQPTDAVASWLPLYHDMGLVACLLIPLLEGIPSVHVSPFEWLEQPLWIFDVAARVGATLIWLPNFAYSMCADAAASAAALPSLAGLRAIINCSEPVQAVAHARFLERLGAAGARADQLGACYAMAEATFAVTQTAPGAPARVERLDASALAAEHRAVPLAPGAPGRALEVVSCGRPIRGIDVAIDGGRERQVGEILLRGEFVIPGYGLEGVARGEAFTDTGWYRTGDLGYLADGELFVTGRAKDLIIHRGSNIYPTDVEDAVADLPGVKPGRVVALGLEDAQLGTEVVILMLELDGTAPAPVVRREARARVLGRLDLALGDVEACEVGTLRKSTSGKLSRSANRALYLERVAARQAGTPGPAAAAAEPRDLWERQLAWIWEELIGRGPIGVDDALYLEWGVDSVTAARAAAAIADRLGVRVDATALLQAESIASQAAVLRRAADGRAAGGERSALITLQPAGAGTDLFLVHAAGGWAFPYVTLARALGRERPVHAFQMPHLTREAGEAPLSALTVPGLAARYLEALRAQRPRGPYLLGGWSFGGLVAIELALRLAAAGEQVERVVLFDTEPPPSAIGRAKDRVTRPVMGAAFRQALHRPWLRRAVPGIGGLDRLSPVWRFFVSFLMTGEEQRIAPLLAWAFGDRADPARLAALAGRGPDDAWAYAVELARGSEAPADRSLLIPGLDGPGARRALRVARRLEVMRHRYRPTQRYQGRVDIIAVAGNAALERWRQAVSGPVQIHPFPLERKYVHPHWDLMEPENVARFAPALQRLLAGQGA